ncbi:unnamed protein product [Caenorhabditis auriculariae]|uniref:Uncharacterized protein n=1 Tax=Caenorhabditis auriculariae TaxID=2777116 RepID=A0A8S1GWG7_9PELO|nr:unnamed protein product [Caenorhabditis auriculariae]
MTKRTGKKNNGSEAAHTKPCLDKNKRRETGRRYPLQTTSRRPTPNYSADGSPRVKLRFLNTQLTAFGGRRKLDKLADGCCAKSCGSEDYALEKRTLGMTLHVQTTKKSNLELGNATPNLTQCDVARWSNSRKNLCRGILH